MKKPLEAFFSSKGLRIVCAATHWKSLNLPELILLKDYFGWWWWWWSAGASVYPYICQSSDCRYAFERWALYTIPGGLCQFLQGRSLIREIRMLPVSGHFQNKTGIPHLSIRFGIWFCAVSGNMADTAERCYCKRRRRLRISYGFLKFAVRKNCSWQPVLKKLDKEAGKALQYSVICKSLWQQKRGTEELTFFIEYCSWINCNAALDY